MLCRVFDAASVVSLAVALGRGRDRFRVSSTTRGGEPRRDRRIQMISTRSASPSRPWPRLAHWQTRASPSPALRCTAWAESRRLRTAARRRSLSRAARPAIPVRPAMPSARRSRRASARGRTRPSRRGGPQLHINHEVSHDLQNAKDLESTGLTRAASSTARSHGRRWEPRDARSGPVARSLRSSRQERAGCQRGNGNAPVG